NWMVEAPFGRLLLAVIALGLAGYAMWRFVQAWQDTENNGVDAQGLFSRGSYAVIGILYLGAACSAAKLALGQAAERSDSTHDWTALLIAKPLGQWLVGLVGLIVL